MLRDSSAMAVLKSFAAGLLGGALGAAAYIAAVVAFRFRQFAPTFGVDVHADSQYFSISVSASALLVATIGGFVLACRWMWRRQQRRTPQSA